MLQQSLGKHKQLSILFQIKFLNPMITRKPKLRRQRKIFRQQGKIPRPEQMNINVATWGRLLKNLNFQKSIDNSGGSGPPLSMRQESSTGTYLKLFYIWKDRANIRCKCSMNIINIIHALFWNSKSGFFFILTTSKVLAKPSPVQVFLNMFKHFEHCRHLFEKSLPKKRESFSKEKRSQLTRVLLVLVSLSSHTAELFSFAFLGMCFSIWSAPVNGNFFCPCSSRSTFVRNGHFKEP